MIEIYFKYLNKNYSQLISCPLYIYIYFTKKNIFSTIFLYNYTFFNIYFKSID